MAATKKMKKGNKGYKSKKGKGKYKPSASIVRGISGFPDVMMTKMKYVSFDTQSSGVGSIDVYTFRGNSVQDPDYTGGGHQPNSFDQYATIYNKYKVMGCKLTIDATNNTDTVGTVVGIQASNSPSFGYTGYPEPIEQQRCKSTILTGKEGQGNRIRLSKYYSSKAILGKKNINDEDYGAEVTTNPTDEWYWHVFSQALNQSSSWQVSIMVQLTYYVKFYDRKNLAAS